MGNVPPIMDVAVAGDFLLDTEFQVKICNTQQNPLGIFDLEKFVYPEEQAPPLWVTAGPDDLYQIRGTENLRP